MLNKIEKLIGNTPLVRIKNYEKEKNLNNKIYAKIEKENPSGSVKDRASFYMIKDAIMKGKVNENTVIIEPTSGNTGIGLAYVCKLLNLKLIIVMPSSMSKERRELIKNYGASLELVDGNMSDCINKAIELSKKIANSYIPMQFENAANPLAHYLTTGPEIYKDLRDVDIVVCGIGSGGTISGIAKFLKEKNPNIKIIGVEPANSPIITKGRAGTHLIQGIGAGFIPKTLNLNYVDEVLTVDDEKAIQRAKELNEIENIFVGISSGAALEGVHQISNKENNKKIVVILPDGGERYSWN